MVSFKLVFSDERVTISDAEEAKHEDHATLRPTQDRLILINGLTQM